MEANDSIPSTAPSRRQRRKPHWDNGFTRPGAAQTSPSRKLANAAGLPVETVTIAEGDGPLTHDAVAVLEALIRVLGRH